MTVRWTGLWATGLSLAAVAASACGGDEAGSDAGQLPAAGTGGGPQVGPGPMDASAAAGTTATGGASGGGGTSAQAGNSAAGGASGAGGPSAAGGAEDAALPVCGNGIVDSDAEECDDANADDEDGCTSMCTFTCSDDDDCVDLDVCDGEETCDLAGHFCQPGTPAEDGTRCGVAMSCNAGLCEDSTCGDGVLHEDQGEECDDGDNYDENDGCTTRCAFSCVPDDPDRNCQNDCNPSSVCDGATHSCTAGEPLADNTLCDLGRGYCVDAVCVASTCGDGNPEPNEECDLGDQNGTPDSGCTDRCTLAECGDGEIGAREQCDDGNALNADACDGDCKVEVVFRLTRLEISLDPVPSFCTFADNPNQGNAMKEVFLGGLLGNAMYELMTSSMGDAFLTGEANLLLQVFDMEDPTAQTPDPFIKIGLSMGELGASWDSRDDKLDFPVLVSARDVDDQNRSLTMNAAEIVMEGGRTFIRSTSPQMVFFRSSEGDFILYGTMAEFEIDPARSQLTAPPDTASSVTLPETIGGDSDETAQGVICGAMPASDFRSIGMPAEVALLCLLEGFTACEGDQDPEQAECDSIVDLLERGCDPWMAPLGALDADTDGDGVNDAYSTLVKASGKRVRLVGVADTTP